MSDYQIAYNATTRTATVQVLNDALPVGSINIGTFEHDEASDPLGETLNHVLFHHVRDALYKRSAVNPANPAMFPYNITDMDRVTIVNDTTANLVPVNTVAPAITGTLEVGSVLTTTNGTWSNSPTYTRQWKISLDNDGPWLDIAAATNTTYIPLIGDLTKFIRCDITATNVNGVTVQVSNVVGPIAADSTP